MLKYIFKTINILAGFICMASVSALDSESWIPLIAFCVSSAYLVFIGWLYGAIDFRELFRGFDEE